MYGERPGAEVTNAQGTGRVASRRAAPGISTMPSLTSSSRASSSATTISTWSGAASGRKRATMSGVRRPWENASSSPASTLCSSQNRVHSISTTPVESTSVPSMSNSTAAAASSRVVMAPSA